MIAAVDKMPKGTTLVDVDDVFETERSVPHADVAQAHVMAQKLGTASNLLGEACKQRDIAYGLILARALRKGSNYRLGVAVRKQLPPGAYLELVVKVEKNWQRREDSLSRLGY